MALFGTGVRVPARGQHLQILLYYGDNRNTRESPVEVSRSALRSFLHYGSYHCNARNSIGRSAAIRSPHAVWRERGPRSVSSHRQKAA